MWTLHKLESRKRQRSDNTPILGPSTLSHSDRPDQRERADDRHYLDQQDLDQRKEPQAGPSTPRKLPGTRSNGKPKAYTKSTPKPTIEPTNLKLTAPANLNSKTASNDPSTWKFTSEDLERFPALRSRNFWCIQRHQARALHYDLRMQLDGSTVSWAIPRGLLGMSKRKEASRLAVQTPLHPLSFTVYEGADGRILPSGQRGGTLLWDIGTYTIGYAAAQEDSDSEEEKRRKRRKSRRGQVKAQGRGRGQGQGYGQDSDDPLGKYEEDKFRMGLDRQLRPGQARTIHFTLKGGRKLDNHSYILILTTDNTFSLQLPRQGNTKKNWFVRLSRDVQEYTWGEGEESERYGRSVKSGRTLGQVCAGPKVEMRVWESEKADFAAFEQHVQEEKS